eukprot:TRINITY_DN3872_c0_g1_i2.p1 TRINITY_DN3872_c0_g1~~TRINITY_DN3872_c0_g1_i2.p1  ORF type:complete len:564 (-),score=141.18 TRINITY_DN3872_c0_g1_i2:55-1746(-)
MFWPRKRKKKVVTQALPPAHPFQVLTPKCQADFLKSGLTEEEVFEDFDQFLRIIFFTSKATKDERTEMKIHTKNIREKYIAYLETPSPVEDCNVRKKSSFFGSLFNTGSLNDDSPITKKKYSLTPPPSRKSIKSPKQPRKRTTSFNEVPTVSKSHKSLKSLADSPNLTRSPRARKEPAEKHDELEKKENSLPDIIQLKKKQKATTKVEKSPSAKRENKKFEDLDPLIYNKKTKKLHREEKKVEAHEYEVEYEVGEKKFVKDEKGNLLELSREEKNPLVSTGEVPIEHSPKSPVKSKGDIQSPVESELAAGEEALDEIEFVKSPRNEEHGGEEKLNVPPKRPPFYRDTTRPVFDPTDLDSLFSPASSNPYKKMNVIGKGAFAKVYYGRSTDKYDKQSYAIKVVENVSKNPKTIHHLANEITLMQKCKNIENMVRYYDSFKYEARDEIWMVMEYCTCSLQDLVIGQLTEVFIKLFTRQMLKALVFLEQMSIVHRDFKSANLLIRVEEEAGTEGTISIKLADFGLAVAVSGTRSGRSVCGSRFWMSPEMLRNEGYGCKVRGLIQER